MKRYLIYLAVIALLGGGFGYLLKNKSSYVLLTYETYAFESSLWFLIILFVLGYFVLNFLVRIFFTVYRPGRKFNAWAFSRRVEASKRDFYQAVLDFETGAWDKALKKFKAAALHLDRPIVAYLYAARSAQKLGRQDIKEEMLHEAAQAEPKSALAVGLVRAELLLAEQKNAEAQKVLSDLKLAAPSNHQIEALLAQLPVS